VAIACDSAVTRTPAGRPDTDDSAAHQRPSTNTRRSPSTWCDSRASAGAAARVAAAQKELRREGARLLAQAEALSAQLAAREDPVVARALREVLDEAARRYEGFAEVTSAVGAAASKLSAQARGTTAQREEIRRDDALVRAKALIARRSFASAVVTLRALLETSGGGMGLPGEVRRAVTDQLDECLRHLSSRAELPPVPAAPAKEAGE